MNLKQVGRVKLETGKLHLLGSDKKKKKKRKEKERKEKKKGKMNLTSVEPACVNPTK